MKHSDFKISDILLFEESNSSNSNNFSSCKSPEHASQDCPLEEPNTPCDVDDIAIIELAEKRSLDYKYLDGRWVEDTPNFDNQRAICLTAHRGVGTVGRLLEVVSDKRGAQTPTKIEIIIANHASCEDSFHPSIFVDYEGSKLQFIGINESEHIEFEVWRRKYGREVSNKVSRYLLESYWPLSVEPNIFNIEAKSCGIRNSGTVNLSGGSKNFKIKVYPSDIYTVKLSIPPYKKTTHTREGAATYVKGTGLVTSHQESKSRLESFGNKTTSLTSATEKGAFNKEHQISTTSRTSTDSSGLTTTQKLSKGNKWSKDKKTAETFISESVRLQDKDKVLTFNDSTEKDLRPIELSTEPTITPAFEVTRNGVVDDTSVKVTELVNTIKYYEHTFKEILNTINNFIPQVGWKMTLDVSFFSGNIYFKWGYREFTDHRVYFHWGGGVEVEVVNAYLDLSFGIEVSSMLTAKVSGVISGKISLTGSTERANPDQEIMPSKGAFSTSGEICGDLFGEAMTGGPNWLKWQRKAGVKCGFEVSAQIVVQKDRGIYIKHEIKFKPLQFYAIVKDPLSGSKPKHFKLTEEQLISKGEFPEVKRKI